MTGSPAQPADLVWLLDVDGVLNVAAPTRVHRHVKLRVRGWPVDVHVDPDVIARVNQVASWGCGSCG